ncbi:MAG TPA: hypothetical protein VFV08_07325, partial [Puia sp.]|nr:hypothetical protein [Puia sp.]
LLIIACFLPWAYYPDIDKTFTGFFSQDNQYGRPGRAFVTLAIIYIVLVFLPKVWAKRFNQFLGVLIFAYAIKNYMVFVSCYRGICPEKKPGIFLILLAATLLLLAAVFTDMKLKNKN